MDVILYNDTLLVIQGIITEWYLKSKGFLGFFIIMNESLPSMLLSHASYCTQVTSFIIFYATRVTCVGVFDDVYPMFVCLLQENAKSSGVFEL